MTSQSDAQPVRVMICDDSAVIRTAVARMLEADPTLKVVASVANGSLAVDEIRRRRPAEAIEVLVLDVEMPVMDGMTALPLLLRADPALRILMSSTLTTRGAGVAMQALRLGAADYVPKPSAAQIRADDSFRRELVEKVRGQGRLRRRAAKPLAQVPPAAGRLQLRPPPSKRPLVLAIGSSTGGPQALFVLIQGLGSQLPIPVILTQHMPAAFTPILAEHITKFGGLPCREAVDGEPLNRGRIYLAPGDRHLLVGGTATSMQAKLTRDPPENFCRPSVEPMLRSAVATCEGRVLLVMLTGMGHDGLAGTRQLISAGGAAIAQDEATSVVWGMPGAIAEAGLCHAVLPLPQIAAKVQEMVGMPSLVRTQ